MKKRVMHSTISSAMVKVEIEAPAKINLHLTVGEKGRDGFHSLVSLFQMVSLHDTIRLFREEKSMKIDLSGNFNFPMANNLIYRAAILFRDYTGITDGVSIQCLKVIPEGSGMGGGSSDAAATLIGLNKLFGANLTIAELMSLGQKIGSDVPFFFGSSTALVTGRGENIKRIKTKWDLPLLIIDTGLQVKTPWAYNKLDSSKVIKKKVPPIQKMYTLTPDKWNFFNDFYAVLKNQNPVYSNAIKTLYTSGALFSMVTGTGSSVFGIFDNENAAENALQSIKNKFNRVYKGKMLAIPPQPVYNSVNN